MNNHYRTEQYKEYLKSKRWEELARQRLQIDKYQCQMCGSNGTSTNGLEVHHWSYPEVLGTEDPYKSLICLCHRCHKSVHRMQQRVTNPDGTRARDQSSLVPHISVYTISGRELYHEELKENE